MNDPGNTKVLSENADIGVTTRNIIKYDIYMNKVLSVN